VTVYDHATFYVKVEGLNPMKEAFAKAEIFYEIEQEGVVYSIKGLGLVEAESDAGYASLSAVVKDIS
jgi:hypothetical protein